MIAGTTAVRFASARPYIRSALLLAQKGCCIISLIKATQSISTSNGPCQGETQTKLRVGGSNGTSCTPVDRKMSRVRAIHVALDKPCYAAARLTRCRLCEVARTKGTQRWLSLLFEFFSQVRTAFPFAWR